MTNPEITNFDSKKPTDTEVATFLIEHIENPCHDAQGNTARQDHILLAKETLKNGMENPHARKLLEDTIKKYS